LLQSRLNYFIRLVAGNTVRVNISGAPDLSRWREKAENQIFAVGKKFENQLRFAFAQKSQPDSDVYIRERIGKASAWFQDEISTIFEDLVHRLQVETDNKELGKKIGKALNNLKQEILVKLAGIKSCNRGFAPLKYLRAVSKSEMDFISEKGKKPRFPEYSEADIENPELFQDLKDWRSSRADEQGVARFQILHQRVLIQIVVTLPANRTDLENIKGVGKKTIEKYGEDILSLVAAYRKKYGIDRVKIKDGRHAAEKTNPTKIPRLT
jgi:superfamily II DNA helicase RecQ